MCNYYDHDRVSGPLYGNGGGGMRRLMYDQGHIDKKRACIPRENIKILSLANNSNYYLCNHVYLVLYHMHEVCNNFWSLMKQ